MPRIRIAAAGAALLLLSGLTAGGATAQTVTDQAPGEPLQLLHWLRAGVAGEQTHDQARRQNSREKDHTHRSRIYQTPPASDGNRSSKAARPCLAGGQSRHTARNDDTENDAGFCPASGVDARCAGPE